jgi:hypothetical protein
MEVPFPALQENVEAVDFRTSVLKDSFNSSISKGSNDEAFRNPESTGLKCIWLSQRVKIKASRRNSGSLFNV